ncbi:hypothetical protein GUITHDRAFT_57032, partial [Guillardia theta CCMP2712]
GICPAGYFCPRASPHPLICPSGYYCERSGFENVTGPCRAGFYCPDPGMLSGILCPVGKYCPQGSISPIPCPKGTASITLGAVDVGQCLSCPVGMYCASLGISEPTGICQAGYLCPSGSVVSAPQGNQSMCPKGYFCPAGSQVPIPCPPGTYNDHDHGRGPSECIPCPAGQFCATGDPRSLTRDRGEICPSGFYCPQGSSQPNACPRGTFRQETGGSNLDECLPCP